MLENAKFIENRDIVVEDRNSWKNMGFNDRSKELPDKGGIPCFFRCFDINKPVKTARLCATALGIFDCFVNGKRVGDGTDFDELKPGWTDYRKRVFAFEYDIKDLLVNGSNDFVAEVSCGWYSCRISFGIYGFSYPAFCAEIEIEYADGETQRIVTDEKWQTALCGPVRTADIWDGEYCDARQKRDSEHKKPVCIKEYAGEITPAMPPRILVRKELELSPVSAVIYKGTKDNGTDFGEIAVTARKEGAQCDGLYIGKGENVIFDMGQNSVGRPRIALRAKAGTKLTFYFGELCNDSGMEKRGNDGAKGSVYVKNYRSALSRFVYVADGEGIEEYAARHTFFGYRYIEIETTDDAEIVSLRAEVISSANRETARFTCSDADVNRLWSNIVWGQRSNYLSIPTDCPQRDERLGWTGDTQIFCGAGSYIADTYDFMRKWMQDVRDSQREDGSLCDVIPEVFTNERFFGNAGWTDACIIVPYVIYKKYGKMQILQENFSAAERYMEYLSGYGLEGGNTAYGDWLCYDVTDKRYIAVCYLANNAQIMQECAALLGKTERAEYYKKLLGDVKAHFADRYIKDNDITEKTQTGYLLALKFNLLPENMRESAKNSLRRLIEDNDYTLSTGFIGTGILCTTLSELGMDDLCYSLLLQTKDPSWLYSVHQGATTVWERWNSYTVEKGFGDVNMNSFNHYAYGAVAEWMMCGMAGIGQSGAGFVHPYIAPRTDRRMVLPKGQKRMDSVSVEYDSAAGLIRSKWHTEGNTTVYETEVPCKSTIDILLFGNSCIVNGREVQAGSRLVLDVEKGTYIIEDR